MINKIANISGPSGFISQSINLSSGTYYQISLKWAGNNLYTPSNPYNNINNNTGLIKTLKISVNNYSPLNYTVSTSISGTDNTIPETPYSFDGFNWRLNNFYYQALSSGNATIKLSNPTEDTYGIVIDSIEICPVSGVETPLNYGNMHYSLEEANANGLPVAKSGYYCFNTNKTKWRNQKESEFINKYCADPCANVLSSPISIPSGITATIEIRDCAGEIIQGSGGIGDIFTITEDQGIVFSKLNKEDILNPTIVDRQHLRIIGSFADSAEWRVQFCSGTVTQGFGNCNYWCSEDISCEVQASSIPVSPYLEFENACGRQYFPISDFTGFPNSGSIYLNPTYIPVNENGEFDNCAHNMSQYMYQTSGITSSGDLTTLYIDMNWFGYWS
jgi:hypothetical protein